MRNSKLDSQSDLGLIYSVAWKPNYEGEENTFPATRATQSRRIRRNGQKFLHSDKTDNDVHKGKDHNSATYDDVLLLHTETSFGVTVSLEALSIMDGDKSKLEKMPEILVNDDASNEYTVRPNGESSISRSVETDDESVTLIIQLDMNSIELNELRKFNRDINDPDFQIENSFLEISLPENGNIKCHENSDYINEHMAEDEISQMQPNERLNERKSAANPSSMKLDTMTPFKQRMRHNQSHYRSRDHNHEVYDNHNDDRFVSKPGLHYFGTNMFSNSYIRAGIISHNVWKTFQILKRRHEGCALSGVGNEIVNVSCSMIEQKEMGDTNKNGAFQSLSESSESKMDNGMADKDNSTVIVKSNVSPLKLSIDGEKSVNLSYNCRKDARVTESDDSKRAKISLVINVTPLIHKWFKTIGFCPDRNRDFGTLVFALMIDGRTIKDKSDNGQQEERESDQPHGQMGQRGESSDQRTQRVGHHQLFAGLAGAEAIIQLKYAMDRKPFVGFFKIILRSRFWRWADG